ncbi:hypothetical protein PSY31_24090, partial [Shigella flexneri]|nr:hypothetical protein [Shigella flexneri]
MPNGACTSAIKKGVVRFDRNIHLDDVLLVPQMTCSLVSISQLTKQLKCVASFSDEVCVIQDR